jgi:hypothetical protein
VADALDPLEPASDDDVDDDPELLSDPLSGPEPLFSDPEPLLSEPLSEPEPPDSGDVDDSLEPPDSLEDAALAAAFVLALAPRSFFAQPLPL